MSPTTTRNAANNPSTTGGSSTGGTDTAPDAVRLLDVRNTALSVDEVLRAVTDPHVGGIALFVGTVRDHTPDNPGEQVTELEYTAHPSALDELRAVAEKVVTDHPGTIL